jgi:sialate O-acetylesterase
VFHWAEAGIAGDSVWVRSTHVKNPVAVRYAWESNPDGNLYNQEGLPAVPFRTDDFKMITQ